MPLLYQAGILCQGHTLIRQSGWYCSW